MAQSRWVSLETDLPPVVGKEFGVSVDLRLNLPWSV